MTHTVTHTGKRADGNNGTNRLRPHPFWTKKRRKALYSKGWKALRWLVRMRSAVRICPAAPQKSLETIRVMFIRTQVDTISCKEADSGCCPLSCVFSLFFIMREARIPRLGAAQCAAAPRPAPSHCPLCRCRGTRCGCSGGNCGSIFPSARLPRSAG